jgi:hypothetical protein
LATVRSEVDDIRRQMAEIRSQLHRDVREVVNVAATATDWRSYVRGRPWLAIGLAFTSGFLLVPRRSRPSTLVVQPSAADVQNLQAGKPGRLPLMRWLLEAVGQIAVRAAQSYATNYVENFLANQQTRPQPEAAPRPASPDQTSHPEGREFATRG